MTLPRALPATLALLAVLLLPGVGRAGFDADLDGVPDEADAYPCDPSAAAAAYAPAQGTHGMLLFEDEWPSSGDGDYNDAALTYNYVFRLDPSGAALSVRATFNALALGGVFDNGLGLHLPVAASAVASVTRTLGAGAPAALTPYAGDAELTVAVSPNLRELFDGQAGQINSVASKPGKQGHTLVVEVVFSAPQVMAFAEAPFDPFLFRAADPSHEIHGTGFAGSSLMRSGLFGTVDDGSTAARHFVDKAGLPFVLDLPNPGRWPLEGVDVSALWPDITTFASSGGAAAKDFYVSQVVGSASYTAVTGVTAQAAFVGADHFPATTGCIDAWGQAVTFGGSRNAYAYDSTVAENGDLVVVGYVRGAYPGQTSAGGLDLTVARYDAQTGAELWLVQLGGAGDETARGVTVDSSGNVYVVGETTSSFSGQSNAGQGDAFVAKLDGAGVLQWVTFIGGAGNDAAYDVAISPQQEVLVVGGTTSSSLSGAPVSGSRSSFFARLDAQGGLQVVMPFQPDAGGTNQDSYATALAAHPTQGLVYVGGAARRYSQSGAAVESQYLVAMDLDGGLTWTQHVGGYGYNAGGADQRYAYAASVSLDATRGLVYLAGHWYAGSAVTRWDTWTRASGDSSADATLTAFGATDGVILWSQSVASVDGQDDLAEAVLVDPATGQVYLTGRTSGAVAGQLSKGGDDYFLAAYGPGGAQQYLVQDGTAAQDLGTLANVHGGVLYLISNTTGALGGPDDGQWDVALHQVDAADGALQATLQASKMSWSTGPWGGCSATCGTGVQTRSVWCVRADGVTVADASCVDVRPASSQACAAAVSCSYAWTPTAWSSCSTTCGGGVQSRNVTCVRSDGVTVADTFCAGAAPASNQACTDVSSCSYAWYTSAYSACSGLCDVGTQSRTVYCKRSDGAQVADAFCGGAAPASSQSCALSACSYDWSIGSWSGCSVACGSGTQSRNVACIRAQDGAQVADTYCAGVKPATSQACTVSNCSGLSCKDLKAQGVTTNGVYTISPAGSGFSGYCEMGVDGGGWTLVMNLNTQDGNISRFLHNIWTDPTYNSIGNRWYDFKSQAAKDLTGTELLLIVRLATTTDGGNILGWRSWRLAGPRTFQSFFSGSIGQSSENTAGGCNSGYSGAGRKQTSGVLSTGACASYSGHLDTFTCRATEVYTNSYYSPCGSNQEAFRMSSYYRWANNSNVGLGLQMDNDPVAYDMEAGNHMDWESNQNPQRHGTPAAIGTDFYTPNNAQGQAWRFEWYVR
jgi:LruC domain-containing protein